jgi:hypothetical protein
MKNVYKNAYQHFKEEVVKIVEIEIMHAAFTIN